MDFQATVDKIVNIIKDNIQLFQLLGICKRKLIFI